jgi:hypothetical protein
MMQSTKKSNSRAVSAWDGNVLTINVVGAGAVMFDRTKASAANRLYAEMHGWNARLIDKMAKSAPTRAAGITEPAWLAQLAAHAQEKFDAVSELAEYYEGGEVAWKMSGAGGSGDGLLLRALMEYRPDKTREQLAAYLATLESKVKTGLLNSPGIAPIANRLRAESAAHVDADEVLAGLDELDDERTIDEQIADELAQ